MSVQEAPLQAPSGPRLECPSCHAPIAPGQDFCLECGHRLSATFRRTPRWWLPVLGAVLLVTALGVGAGFAVAELVNDEEVKKEEAARAQPPPPASTPPPVSTPAPAPTTPTPPGSQTTPPPAGQEPAPGQSPDPAPPAGDTSSPGGGGELAQWPPGRTAYTVVLQSSEERGAAEAKAREAGRAGVPAGLLFSSDYSSLKPGYWVVFAGQFKDFEQANRAARRYAGQGFGGGYPRLVRK